MITKLLLFLTMGYAGIYCLLVKDFLVTEHAALTSSVNLLPPFVDISKLAK